MALSDQQIAAIVQQDTVSKVGPMLLAAGVGYAMGGQKGAVIGAVVGYVAANALTIGRVLTDPRVVQ